MNEFLLVFGMSLVTFAVRYPMLVIFGKLNPPDSIFRALKYVPPAVLTAIIVPALIFPDGSQLTINLTNAYLLAGFVAFGVAWRSRNLLWTIIIGMTTFWIWRWALTF